MKYAIKDASSGDWIFEDVESGMPKTYPKEVAESIAADMNNSTGTNSATVVPAPEILKG